MRSASLVLALLAFSTARAVSAQQAFSIPQSAAFTYLDVSPTKVERPTTARDFGAGLMNGIDAQGRVRQGIAVEGAPWPWIPGLSIPASSYGEVGKYLLANLSLSVASARSAGDTASTDFAVGLRTTILDRSDPMASPEFRASLRAAAVTCNSADAEATEVSIRLCTAQSNTDLREEWLAEHWNEASLSVALASGARLKDSRLDQGNWSGLTGWASLALPLTDRGQLVVQGRFDHQAKIDSVASATAWRMGGRATFGSAIFNGFFELEHNSEPISGADPKTAWTGGVEFRATDEIWIATGFGEGYSVEPSDKVVLIANVRWRVSSVPSLAP
jgi:hypothetical protein